MLSPKIKRNIGRIIPFGVIWLIFSTVYVLLEKGLLGSLNYYPSTTNPYNFSRSIFFTPVFALLTGLVIGTIEVLYFNKFFVQKTFVRKIIYKALIYLVTIIFFLTLTSIIANSLELQTTIFDQQVWNNARAFFADYAFLSVGVYMAAVIIISQFYAEVSENIGQVVLNNFFTGKYHQPLEEERIFMFLDMKSSTRIAEKLGHIKYFEMLKEYYSDLSDPIISYSGEIYQYVGDEIVVSWTLRNGLNNDNCIQCFFAMKAALRKHSAKYQEQFGLLPEFKAGFHLGKVTTGEIGVIKKEIIFTGDVLNTAARIQGLCNTYEVDVLVSDNLMKKLHLAVPYQTRSLGENELRGRNEKIALFTIFSA
jgi:adenylate cyclase